MKDVTDGSHHHDWTGWYWTDSGRYLKSPDGDRISTPHRLRGLLWRDKMELRLAGWASRKSAETNRGRKPVKVIVVDINDWRERHFGRAG